MQNLPRGSLVHEMPKYILKFNFDKEVSKYLCPRKQLYKPQYNRVTAFTHPDLGWLAVL